MSKFQVIVAVTFALLIGYGAGYFTYLARFPPAYRRAVATESAPGETPQKDWRPLHGTIQKAKELQAAGKLPEAQRLLRDQLRIYPQVKGAQDARELLGTINTALFFSDQNLYGKTEHVVERGESLARIAQKLNSTPDLIMRANNLESTLIHPGDRLLVPDGEFTLTIDVPNARVVVHHGDGFFKQYPIQGIDLPPGSQPRLATKVKATMFWKDGERISAASPEIDEATPWIHLARRGYVLYGVSEQDGIESDTVEVTGEETENKDASAKSEADIPRRGIALLKDDLTELLMLVRRGTPVTIIRDDH